MVRTVSWLLLFCVLLLSGCSTRDAESDLPVLPTTSPIASSTSSSTDSVPVPTSNIRIVDPDENPIAGARIGDHGLTDVDGRLALETPEGETVIEADGYVPRYVSGWHPGDRQIVLRPIVVQGSVLTPAGEALAGVTVTLGDSEILSDASGRFEFVAATVGTIRAVTPGWSSAEVEWLGLDNRVSIEMEPMVVRALHVSGWAVGDDEHWQRLLDLAAATEINSLVVDLKDESGLIFYPSTVALAEQVEAIRPVYRLEDVVEASADAELYLIGRIVTFQDPIAARAAPELAVWDTGTGAPYRKNGQYFLDPTDADARQYALDLAVESCEAGFDEIQFDYVRFPDGFGNSAVFDQGSGSEIRPIIIRDFLAEASALLNPAGCAVAADIFGFITSTTGDGGIGQYLEELASVVDVLSPMLYPSHYSEGWFGFDVPNDHPGPVVGRALDDGMERLDSTAVFRPWIQDFYYNAAQVRAEIEAAEARGLGWMLWNAVSRFTEGALLPAD